MEQAKPNSNAEYSWYLAGIPYNLLPRQKKSHSYIELAIKCELVSEWRKSYYKGRVRYPCSTKKYGYPASKKTFQKKTLKLEIRAYNHACTYSVVLLLLDANLSTVMRS